MPIPPLMGRKGPMMVVDTEDREQPKDPIMTMVDCMRNHDLAGCLMALADYFAKETNETES